MRVVSREDRAAVNGRAAGVMVGGGKQLLRPLSSTHIRCGHGRWVFGHKRGDDCRAFAR